MKNVLGILYYLAPGKIIVAIEKKLFNSKFSIEAKIFFLTLSSLNHLEQIRKTFYSQIKIFSGQLFYTFIQDFATISKEQDNVMIKFKLKTFTFLKNLIKLRDLPFDKKDIIYNLSHLAFCITIIFINIIIIPISLILASITSSLIVTKYCIFLFSGIQIPYKTGFGFWTINFIKANSEIYKSSKLIVKDIISISKTIFH